MINYVASNFAREASDKRRPTFQKLIERGNGLGIDWIVINDDGTVKVMTKWGAFHINSKIKISCGIL